MRTLAVFDFDGTLIKGDSLWAFLAALHGPVHAAASFANAFICGALHPDGDLRTAIKTRWLQRMLVGVSVNEARLAAEKIKAGLRWKEPQRTALQRLAEQGADIVIATGALDIYIQTLLEGLPIKAVLCTTLERTDAGVLTGRISGANAVRDTKGAWVADYIRANGPYNRIIGYGNMPNDGPMLSHCTERHVV